MNTSAFGSFVTDDEARGQGLAARKALPRRAHADVSLAIGRDPFAIIAAQNQSRQPDLVGLRWERMLTDPFAFYRGTAAIMAADLAAGPSTGFTAVACGDAHLANFGFYASPQRTLAFDLNDFDEAAVAPWEWDVKRLAVSFAMGGSASAVSARTVSYSCFVALRGNRSFSRSRRPCDPSSRSTARYLSRRPWVPSAPRTGRPPRRQLPARPSSFLGSATRALRPSRPRLLRPPVP